MPRAFCPECASEVPVDSDGVCHVGHYVDLGGAPAGATGTPGAGTGGPDEPQPWVASVAPSDAPEEGPPQHDDLAAAAAAAAAAADSVEPGADAGPDVVEASGEQVEAGWPETLPSEGEAPGWTPPTNDPVTPPPVPPPAPADPPAPAPADDVSAGDVDLDELATAVSDLDMDDAAPAPTTGSGDPAADVPPRAPDTTPAPPDATIDWDDELGEPSGSPDRPGGARATGGDGADEIDLANFTAKSGKVKTDRDAGGRTGGRRGRR